MPKKIYVGKAMMGNEVADISKPVIKEEVEERAQVQVQPEQIRESEPIDIPERKKAVIIEESDSEPELDLDDELYEERRVRIKSPPRKKASKKKAKKKHAKVDFFKLALGGAFIASIYYLLK